MSTILTSSINGDPTHTGGYADVPGVSPAVPHHIVVQWAGLRGSNVHLGESASLSAIFEVFGVT